jgi:hypothetical protein
MKEIIINSYLNKGEESERKNFNIRTNSTDESVVVSKIIEKLNIDTTKYRIDSQKFEFIPKENVVIYKCLLKNN